MERKKIIDKIYKCLRLAESVNPNEAAAAMRQAQRLMRKHGITRQQMLAGQVSEAAAQAGDCPAPPFWLLALGELVADAYNCRAYVRRGETPQTAFHFIGLAATPQSAVYTFSVLQRSLVRDRSKFVEVLEGTDKAECERQGDIFAQAWLFRIARSVSRFAANPHAQQSIEAYIKSRYGDTGEFTNTPVTPDRDDYQAIARGLRAAAQVNLLRPVAETGAMAGLLQQPA
ncbi:MAG: DUF2786 domain-containing protein [Pseudomonadota bacterium]|nr:MAG: DUF2786 domain-containing protein [Pseudomonadota bacterium]